MIRYKLEIFKKFESYEEKLPDKIVDIINKLRNENVINLDYMGAGEKKGIQFFDEVTQLEISSLDRINKEYVYIFGFLLLFLTIASQKMRLKRNF